MTRGIMRGVDTGSVVVIVTLIVALVATAIIVPYLLTRVIRSMLTTISESVASATVTVSEAIGRSVQVANAPIVLPAADLRPAADAMPAYESDADNLEDGFDATDAFTLLSGVERMDAATTGGSDFPFGVPGLRKRTDESPVETGRDMGWTNRPGTRIVTGPNDPMAEAGY